VEQVCDRVAIVDHGKVVATGPLDDLLSSKVGVRIRVTGLDREGVDSMRRFGRVVEADGWISIEGAGADDVPELVAEMVRRGGRVYAVEPQHESLEQRFMSLLGGEKEETTWTP
jgi:ABC-2 type transport system ATP-binding protein